MRQGNRFEVGLEQRAANHVTLSPLSFLERTAVVYPYRSAIVYGDIERSWAETCERCCRLASQLQNMGIGAGDTVAVMLPNVPAMVELHFAIPMTGAVINTLNTRLDATSIAMMLHHGEARLLFTDPEFSEVVEDALDILGADAPRIVDVIDPLGPEGKRLGSYEYEKLVEHGSASWSWQLPGGEWDAISLNYTSGTTGQPKGVVYHHRGAYLNAISNIVSWGMPAHAVYLWVLPMFHCNGWCFPWTIAANAGTNVCLRKFDPEAVLDLIRRHKVTHFCGAPVVHAMLANCNPDWWEDIDHTVQALVAGAAPSAMLIEKMSGFGIRLSHVYGLTETYGPAAICAVQEHWAALPASEQAALIARQGVSYHLQESMAVLDPETMQPVPADGRTLGEVMFRGNLVMKGYLKDEAATRKAFAGGWFHSGDLAVLDPDGYVRIRDRSKDIIISGGENIASLEVEEALYQHPAVFAAAVIARDDDKWGEVPCAYIELVPGMVVTEDELTEHCQSRLARYKVPKAVVFGELPKTATGKIKKHELRHKASLRS